MTYIVKTRGAGAYLVAEYRCPLHDVFEATVQRNDGDAPDEQPCPVELVSVDLEAGETVLGRRDVVCGEPSPWTPSAPKPKIWSKPATAAIRGGDMKERPPGMLDTRPLAEGMPYKEWEKKQAEAQRARRHQELIDKGITQKKIIVGGGT